MTGEPGPVGENVVDSYVQAGLRKESIRDTEVYSLDVTNPQESVQSLQRLKETLKGKRVAVEIGPGNQLDSLVFAGKHSKADVVIGIDTNFDTSSIKPPDIAGEKTPQIILIKGDAWGNKAIMDLFGAYEDDRSKRLAVYAQLVAPDTDAAERMIDIALLLSKDGFMVVLDSGAVEVLQSNHFPEHDIHRILMRERGIEDPSQLDWIKHRFRGAEQIDFTKEQYE